MATARERLLQALTAIISQPFNDDGKNALVRLLNSYRVQAKPGENIEKNLTARDALANNIIEMWTKNCPIEKRSLNQIISAFRMQLKQGFSRGNLLDVKTSKTHDHVNITDHTKGLTRLQIKQNTTKHENAYFKDRSVNNQNDPEHKAIAGGPKQGSNSRGKCPKCRSMGIVLARAYGGDDYHSCIYCGYQAYLKDADAKLDLPLAAELLGNAFGDPDVE